MNFVLTPQQMREADKTAIEKEHISSRVLMENAARSSAEYIKKILRGTSSVSQTLTGSQALTKILVLCGSGNNGGDGFAIARHLVEDFDMNVHWIGKKEGMSEETRENFEAASLLGLISSQALTGSESLADFNNYDCIIDALIGVGGSENLRGPVIPLLKEVNRMNGVKIAIDAPTGLNTETGIAHEDSFKADYTITMFAMKTGMLLNDGLDVCGEILIADLGVPIQSLTGSQSLTYKSGLSNIYVLGERDIRQFFVKRHRRSSKFDYGKVVVIAGSRNMPGAAALCSNAAITSGAGLVYLFSPTIHPAVLPEVIPQTVPMTDEGTISVKAYDAVMSYIEKANSLIIGPGMGTNAETIEFIRRLLKELPEYVSVVIDADAIRVVNGLGIRNEELGIEIEDKTRFLQNDSAKAITSRSLRTIIKGVSRLGKNIVLTPHTGEFAGLTGIERAEVEKRGHELVVEWADKLNCIILLKHVPSIITDGTESYWNINGNPGMATAGSGDVLSGIIAGFIAQGIEPFKAAAVGAYIHAKAGDWYAERYSQETLTATALIETLKHVL